MSVLILHSGQWQSHLCGRPFHGVVGFSSSCDRILRRRGCFCSPVCESQVRLRSVVLNVGSFLGCGAKFILSAGSEKLKMHTLSI